MTSHSKVFRRFSIKVSAMWDDSKASFKTSVTLFLRKNLIYLWLKLILIYNTNISTNLGNLFQWPLNLLDKPIQATVSSEYQPNMLSLANIWHDQFSEYANVIDTSQLVVLTNKKLSIRLIIDSIACFVKTKAPLNQMNKSAAYKWYELINAYLANTHFRNQ